MKTKILYYDDINLLEFEANIISSETKNKEIHIILDQTAFYPESGGMNCDIGYIDDCKVIKVIKKDDEIIHVLDSEPTNKKIHGKVDPYTRLINIQFHDAQHVLTALFEKDYDLKTISHHTHNNYCDLVLEGQALTREMLIDIEHKANQLIIEQRKLDIFFISKTDLNKYGLKDNPKYSDPVRITNIEGVNDYNACGCLHFDNLSKIQGLKCLDIEKTGKQNKFTFTAGLKMIELLDEYHEIITELKAFTKANENTLVKKIKDVYVNNTDLSKELKENKLALYTAKLTDLITEDNIIIYEDSNNNYDDLKIMANAITNYQKPIKAFLQIKKNDKYQFILVKQKNDPTVLDDIFTVLKTDFKVHGGGSQLMINGVSSVDLISEIEKYW